MAETSEKLRANAIQIIKSRRSCRNFDGNVDAGKLRKLEDFMCGLRDCPFGSDARFKVVDIGSGGMGKVQGTYGVIKGARLFITGAVRKGPNDLYDFGFLFEQIILYATSLGLGTCWLGGTFNRSSFADKMGLITGEILPAVSPVGVPSGKGSIVDTVFRIGAKSSTRLEWEELFCLHDFNLPLTKEQAGKYAVALEMVRLGPSASNKQPWRIVKNSSGMHLYIQRSDKYDALKDIDLQRIDMGIAMCHFDAAARAEGLGGEWKKLKIGLAPAPSNAEYIASWCD